MGMYDTVRIEWSHPVIGDNAGLDFQTKRLDCWLNVYTITAEGRLVLTDSPYRDVLLTQPVDQNYHGWLNVYTSHAEGEWVEFNIKFTDGVAVDAVVVPDDQAAATPRGGSQ